MNTSVELKEEISFDEFKAWMNGLVRGKGSVLPSIEDWKVIKKMMDKVVPDIEQVYRHTPIYAPETPFEYQKYPQTPMEPWCVDSTSIPSYGGYGTGQCTTTGTSLGSTAYGAPLTTSDLKLKINPGAELKVSQIAPKSK